MCSHIGVREGMHYETNFCANESDLLTGKRYENAVLNGTYRVDVHHSEDNGITFKYLDGRYETLYGKKQRRVSGNWRQEAGLSGEAAKFYQVPFDILVQNQYKNIVPVGRMIHADSGAFGALRVMVNINQLGEAAGTAAFLSLDTGNPVYELDGQDVRKLLIAGGAAL